MVLDADAQPIDELRAQLRCLYSLRSELGRRRHIADAAAIRLAAAVGGQRDLGAGNQARQQWLGSEGPHPDFIVQRH